MDDLIAAASAAMGWPAAMVERSARARAKAQGVEVEAVLRAWAGGGEIDAGTAAAPTADAAAEPAPTAAAPAPAAEPVLEVEVSETAPAEPTPAEPEPEPEPEPVRPSVPTWLAASFVLIPAIAIMYALFFPNGPGCGVGPQLAIDPVTGEAENCDGSPYGVDAINYFAMGQDLYAGNCAACHGADGEGGGNFPALNGGAVLATFSSCTDHISWVELGSLGWPDATYGDTAKPVGGSGAQMPAFANVLSPEELASVVLFERVAYGGVPIADAELNCDLTAVVAAAE